MPPSDHESEDDTEGRAYTRASVERGTDTEETEPMDLHVGRRIWQRRRELGLSRRELGERVGVGLKQVNKYETGANRVSAGRLFEISHVLRVRPSWFFDDFSETPVANEPLDDDPPAGDTTEIRNLLAVYHTIPRGVRGRLLRLVRAIADAYEE